MTIGGERRPGRLPAAVRAARWILWALLLGCAALTLFGLPELQRAVSQGRWPSVALGLPPALLALFIVGYAAYRLALARAGRYPAGKALVQVGVMVLVLGIVVGIARRPIDRAGDEGPVALGRPLRSTDPEVRALAAEALAHRPREEVLGHLERLVELLDDRDARVLREAHAALVAAAGRDAGGQGPGAAARWRAHFAR